MIIKHYNTCFALQFEQWDWYCRSTYDLNDFIKSIDKTHRRFDWNQKAWIISNHYNIVLEKMQIFTEAEELEADIWLTDFAARLN